MSANPFRPLGSPLNITVGAASVAYPIPGKGMILLLSHLGTVPGEHVYYEFGSSAAVAVIPTFAGGASDNSLALPVGSIQTRYIPDGVTHIALVAASDQFVSLETGDGD